ncbi:hypothetical protein VTP01DRAFT_12 [Rhizomucor pusillus]|uniref:uncharacterized protein n=1 Tax=Rhizomucor pusillus TaxID=4840 RepID=UPI00374228E2
MPGLVWSPQEIQALLRWIAENNRQTTWNRQDSLRGVQNALIPYNPVYFHGTSGIQRIRSKLVNLYKAYVNCYEAVTPIGASRSSTCVNPQKVNQFRWFRLCQQVFGPVCPLHIILVSRNRYAIGHGRTATLLIVQQQDN